MSLFKSAFIVGGGTLLSRIVGYIRDIMIAYALGVGVLADAFFVATRLPNCFRSITAEGAFNSAFVPMFSGKLAQDGKEKSINFANQVFSFMLLALTIFSIIIMVLMPYVTQVLAPGFKDNPEQFSITVELSRIAFPYLLLVSLVALQGGVLNSFGKFAAPALSSVLLNICMIIALLTLTDITGSAAHALSWGMTISGIVQFIWLYFSNWRIGITLKPGLPKMDGEVKSMLRKMVPGIIGSSATQINVVINTMLATLIPGGVSYLYYADRLVQFPMAIIGTAMGTALLPVLSKHFKLGSIKEAISQQNRGLEFAMLFTLPSAFALAVISEPLIDIMFERGQFSATATAATAAALTAYAFGLPAFVMVKVFAPGFFAGGDTKTPVKIAVLSMLCNVITGIILINHLQHVGLAIGTSLGSWVNSLLLCIILTKRNLFKIEKQVLVKVGKIFASSIVMAALLVIEQDYLRGYFMGKSLHLEAAYIILLVASGLAFFFLSLRIWGGYTFKGALAVLKSN